MSIPPHRFPGVTSLSFLFPTFLLFSSALPAQCDFLASTAFEWENETLRLIHINPDDSLTEIASAETIGSVSHSMHVDPRGNWAYVPFESPDIGELYEITTDDKLVSTDSMTEFMMGNDCVTLRPDGNGLFLHLYHGYGTTAFYQYHTVSQSFDLVPASSSREYDPFEEDIGGSVFSC